MKNLNRSANFMIRQSGQAYAEGIVGILVILIFMLGGHHLWRYGEASQIARDAMRFAAWERTVWEPQDNAVEKHALHKKDSSLARGTVLQQLSMPAAVRASKSNFDPVTLDPIAPSMSDSYSWLRPVIKSFVRPGTDINSLITIKTTSDWINESEKKIRGMDPTYNTLTSLELDKDTYRKISMRFNTNVVPDGTLKDFHFGLPALTIDQTFSLITNTWAGSPPMQRVRTRQLSPITPGDKMSDTKPNYLSYYGLSAPNSDKDAYAGNFVGLMPWWNFLAGPNGLAGQFVVTQIGLDAMAVTSLAESHGQSYKFNSLDPSASLLLNEQMSIRDFINPSQIPTNHKHVIIKDKTTDSKTEPDTKARNSNNAKRKNMTITLQNPVLQFFSE